MNKILLLLLVVALVSACGGNKQQKETAASKPADFSQAISTARQVFGKLPAVAENVNNPITEEKVVLGKALYFDKRLSKDETQSCNTCHDLKTFGVDNLPTSPGNNGGFGDRNSPTTLNAALHFTQFWDGREPDVEAQAGGPILNPVEMEMTSEEAVIARLSEIEEYQQLFAKAFPEEKSPITYENLKKAIGAFERKLITPTRFDDLIAGKDDALSKEELKGLQTFVNSGCMACHTGPLLGGNMYQKFGVFAPYWEFTKSEKIDSGRYVVTQNVSDQFMFKVPSLRNVEKTAPYFHDGSVADLSESIKIMGKAQLNKDLTNQEVAEIITFLKTLTGEVPQEYIL